MKNKEILNKLFKITNDRQKVLVKLAQAIATPVADLPTEAHNYINSIITLWITNSGHHFGYNFTLQDSTDPGYNYELAISMKLAKGGPLSSPSDIIKEMKDYLAGKLANSNFFKGKNIKIDIHLNVN